MNQSLFCGNVIPNSSNSSNGNTSSGGSNSSSDSSSSGDSSSSSANTGGASGNSSNFPVETENGVGNIGLGVFQEGKLVGKLDATETLMHLMMTNELKNCNLTIPDPKNTNKTIDLFSTLNQAPQIKVSILNGTPYVQVKLKIDSRISSMHQISEMTEEQIVKIEKTAQDYLNANLSNYLYQTSKLFHSDISGIGKHALGQFSTIGDFNNYNWLEHYEDAFFEVETEVEIKSGFLLTGS